MQTPIWQVPGMLCAALQTVSSASGLAAQSPLVASQTPSLQSSLRAVQSLGVCSQTREATGQASRVQGLPSSQSLLVTQFCWTKPSGIARGPSGPPPVPVSSVPPQAASTRLVRVRAQNHRIGSSACKVRLNRPAALPSTIDAGVKERDINYSRLHRNVANRPQCKR